MDDVPLVAPLADLLYLGPVKVAAPLELLVGGEELLLYLRGVAVLGGMETICLSCWSSALHDRRFLRLASIRR